MQAIFRVKDAAALATTFAIYNEYVNQDHSGDPCYNDNFAAATSMVTKHYGTQGSETYEQLIVSGERQAFPKDWLKKIRGLELDGCIELITLDSQELTVNNSGLQNLSCEPIMLPYWMDARQVFQDMLPASCCQMFWAKALQQGRVQHAGEEDFFLNGDYGFAQQSVIDSAYKWLNSDDAVAVRTLQLVKGYLKVAANLQAITAESIRNM